MNKNFVVPELYATSNSIESLKIHAGELFSWSLTPRQICDLELIMNGGFYPLEGFLRREDYEEVVQNMRLANGKIWPIPITLDVSEEFANSIKTEQEIALRDQEGVILAILSVSDKWTPNKENEAEKVFDNNDLAHPAVNYLKILQAQFIWVEKLLASKNQLTMIFEDVVIRQMNYVPILKN